MSKIKDLAIVAVESAFMLFPVTQERYELGRAIELTSNLSYDGSVGGLVSEDWRVNLWIRERDALFQKAALDFNWYMSPQLRSNLSKLGLDRARRCEATLRFWLTDVRWERVEVAMPDVICGYLWYSLLRACIVTGDFSLPLSSKG